MWAKACLYSSVDRQAQTVVKLQQQKQDELEGLEITQIESKLGGCSVGTAGRALIKARWRLGPRASTHRALFLLRATVPSSSGSAGRRGMGGVNRSGLASEGPLQAQAQASEAGESQAVVGEPWPGDSAVSQASLRTRSLGRTPHALQWATTTARTH